MKALEQRITDLEKELSMVKQQNKTAALPSQLSTEAQSSSPNMNTNEPIPLSKPTQVSNADINTTVASFLAEEKEKEKDRRRLNLIVHQLAEPNETDAQKRKECDVKETSDIIQKYLGVSATLTNPIRLGIKGAKPRLLKISVSSRQEKAQILKNCTKLRNKEHPSNIQKIYITPDLTPKEQQANKALRSQLDEMNKPDKLYKIKNGKIVRRED